MARAVYAEARRPGGVDMAESSGQIDPVAAAARVVPGFAPRPAARPVARRRALL
jgi:hypothetical protein